jgi:hypothetical protein
MVRHPFERTILRAIRLACLGLFIAWGVLTVVLFAVVPFDHARELWLFLHANDAGEAAARVAAWPADVRATARLLVGLDVVYDRPQHRRRAPLPVGGAA